MSKLTQLDVLNAFKPLRYTYKEILRDWLRKHNKKGVKYTRRLRGEYIDEDGYSHYAERFWCDPLIIEFDGQISIDENTLPVLSITKMKTIFKKAGYQEPNWDYLSKHYDSETLLIDYFNDTYKG